MEKFCDFGEILASIAMPCAVLSGGIGRRMGQYKQDLPFCDSTLADFQAKRLKQIFNNVYFSAKTQIANAYGVPTILDDAIETTEGLDSTCNSSKPAFVAPIFGLQSTLESLKCDVFILSIDAPFFDLVAIKAALEAFRGNAIFAKNSKIHPLLGIYPFKSLAQIKSQIKAKNYKLTQLLSAINAEFVEIPESKTRNLNSYADYQQACIDLANLGAMNG